MGYNYLVLRWEDAAPSLDGASHTPQHGNRKTERTISVKKKKGIYVIRHKTTRKCYVGRDSHLPFRSNKHFRGKCPGCTLIHRAIQKHGREAFDLFIIEIPGASSAMLNDYEKVYIRLFRSKSPYGYNQTDGGDGAINPTAEVREKLSANNPMKRPEVRRKHKGLQRSPETRQKIAAARLGKTLSHETRQKIGDAHRGRTLTAQHRQKVSDGLRGKTIPPEVRQKISNSNRGKKRSAESRKKMSEAARGRKLSLDHRQKIADANRNRTCKQETRQKISEAIRRKKHTPEAP